MTTVACGRFANACGTVVPIWANEALVANTDDTLSLSAGYSTIRIQADLQCCTRHRQQHG
jgi:hypothetical protein